MKSNSRLPIFPLHSDRYITGIKAFDDNARTVWVISLVLLIFWWVGRLFAYYGRSKVFEETLTHES
jgi:hypothetical protein